MEPEHDKDGFIFPLQCPPLCSSFTAVRFLPAALTNASFQLHGPKLVCSPLPTFQSVCLSYACCNNIHAAAFEALCFNVRDYLQVNMRAQRKCWVKTWGVLIPPHYVRNTGNLGQHISYFVIIYFGILCGLFMLVSCSLYPMCRGWYE